MSRHGSKIENGSRHGSQIGHGASRHGSKIGDHEHLVHVEEVKKIEIYTDHDGVKHIDETITTTRRRDSSCSSQSTVKANDDTVSRHSVKSAKSNGGAIGTGAAVAPANGIGQGASVIEHTVHPTDPAQINLDQIFQVNEKVVLFNNFYLKFIYDSKIRLLTYLFSRTFLTLKSMPTSVLALLLLVL